MGREISDGFHCLPLRRLRHAPPGFRAGSARPAPRAGYLRLSLAVWRRVGPQPTLLLARQRFGQLIHFDDVGG